MRLFELLLLSLGFGAGSGEWKLGSFRFLYYPIITITISYHQLSITDTLLNKKVNWDARRQICTLCMASSSPWSWSYIGPSYNSLAQALNRDEIVRGSLRMSEERAVTEILWLLHYE